jgi:hypothetical protein
MKVAGAEPINNEGSPWAMDTIDFAAPAADPLDHECNRIKCSLALKLVNQSALYTGSTLPIAIIRALMLPGRPDDAGHLVG